MHECYKGMASYYCKAIKNRVSQNEIKKYKTEAQENLNFRKQSKSEDKLTETSASPDYFPNSIKQSLVRIILLRTRSRNSPLTVSLYHM